MAEILVFHDAANSFPMMDAKRFSELKESIRVNGLREAIMLCEGKILDGRNRWKACQELGKEVATRQYAGDPWTYVWDLNGNRRDINADQRFLIWKFCHEHSEAWQREREKIKDEANKKRSEANKGIPYAPKGGTRKPEGDKVVEQSVPLPFPSLARPHLARNAAAVASKTNPGAVARGEKLAKERPDLAEDVRLGKKKPAEAHRQMKRDAVVAKVKALPRDKYLVIYADPPWDYNDKQAVKGAFGTGTGAAEGHYPSMKLSELKAMGIPDIADTDSVLFLWVTSPLLPDGLELAAAWGFKYKASFVWDKIKHNMGHYNSVRHEFLLVCTKGSCTPQVVKLFDSVQSIERTDRHSEKPEEFRKIIDTLYPNGKRIELFSRTNTEGWEHYGAERT